MNENIELDLIFDQERDSRIALTGSINNVLSATIDDDNSLPRTPQQVGYSLGLGAMGDSFSEAALLMGELCTLPKFIGVLTSGEKNETRWAESPAARFWTPFNVSIGNDFEEVYAFSCVEPCPMGELYSVIFDIAMENPHYRGLIAASIYGEIESFYGSLVKTAPLTGSIDTGRIIDPAAFKKWFQVDDKPVYSGHQVVSVGVGLDLTFDEPFPKKTLDRIFYLHPANAGQTGRILHNHCFILPKLPLPDEIESYNEAVSTALRQNGVLDVKHILDSTTLKKGFIAVNYIRKISEF